GGVRSAGRGGVVAGKDGDGAVRTADGRGEAGWAGRVEEHQVAASDLECGFAIGGEAGPLAQGVGGVGGGAADGVVDGEVDFEDAGGAVGRAGAAEGGDLAG